MLSVEEIIEKLNSLNKNSLPRWGEMNFAQMIKHCSSFIDLCLCRIEVPFWYKYFGITIGKLLIYISKKSPLKHPENIKTEKSIKIIDENLDFDYEKEILIAKLNKVHKLKGKINHPIYGNMKSEKSYFLLNTNTQFIILTSLI